MRKKWVKFKNLDKKDKIFRIINLILMLAFCLVCIALGIYNACIGDPRNRLFSCFAIAIVSLLPIIIELIFGRRLPNLIVLFFLIYVFLAGFGSVLDLYGIIPYYDKFIHVLAGYVFAVLGLIVISLLDDYYKFKPWTIALFTFCFTLSVSLCWELMEWAGDSFFGQTAQGDPIPPYNAPLVTDTDEDMLCNFCGGLIFFFFYLLGKYTKVAFGIKFYEKEFVFKKSSAVEKNEEVVFSKQENAESDLVENVLDENLVLDKNEQNDDKNKEKN